MKSAGPLATALLVSLSLRAPADEPRVGRVTTAVELTITNVDVVVTDSDGRHVPSLSAADFEVFEGRRPMAITNFQEYASEPRDGPAAPEASSAGVAGSVDPAAPRPAARPPRSIVLFVDRLRLPDRFVREPFFASVKAALRRMAGPGDRVMLVRWVRSVAMLVPFTNDLAAVEKALDAIENASTGAAPEDVEHRVLQDDEAWFQSIEGDPRATKSSGIGPSQRLLAAAAFHDMKRKSAALTGLVSGLGGVEGKKVLLLATHRFSRYAGLEYFAPSSLDPVPLDAREFDARGALEALVDAANASAVTIYGLYPSGRPTAHPSAADRTRQEPTRLDRLVSNEEEALDLVADRTGGFTAVGPVAIGKALPRAAEDLDAYYSIGYRASAGKPDRAVSVVVRVRRPGLTVRARRAVITKSDAARMKDRVVSNLFLPDASGRIPVAVGFRRKDDGASGRGRFLVEVRFPVGRLATVRGAKGVAGSFSVFVASAGPLGELSEVTRETRPFEIPDADLETARRSHFTFAFEAASKGGEIELSVGVFDEVGRDAGFARLRLSTPRDGDGAR